MVKKTVMAEEPPPLEEPRFSLGLVWVIQHGATYEIPPKTHDRGRDNAIGRRSW
jgi:hypothetical protein